jgi:hypothetical protein
MKGLIYLVAIVLAVLLCGVTITAVAKKMSAKDNYEMSRVCADDAQKYAHTFSFYARKDAIRWHYNTRLNRCLLRVQLSGNTEALYDVTEKNMLVNFAFGGIKGTCIPYASDITICDPDNKLMKSSFTTLRTLMEE